MPGKRLCGECLDESKFPLTNEAFQVAEIIAVQGLEVKQNRIVRKTYGHVHLLHRQTDRSGQLALFS